MNSQEGMMSFPGSQSWEQAGMTSASQLLQKHTLHVQLHA